MPSSSSPRRSISSSGGGLGCLAQLALSVLIVGALIAAWFWSQGADPRQAVQDGLTMGAGLTLCPVVILAVLLAWLHLKR